MKNPAEKLAGKLAGLTVETDHSNQVVRIFLGRRLLAEFTFDELDD